jgi:Protein of unknown function (DUF3450)
MKKRLLLASVLFVGLFDGGFLTRRAMAASQPATVSDSQTDLLEKLQGLVTHLRQRRQDYYRQRALDETEMQTARENRTLLQTQLDNVRKQEADLDRQLEAHHAQIQTLEAQLKQKAAVQHVVAREIMTFASEQKSQVAEGIPYKRSERIARLPAGVADANESARTSVAGQLGHLWSYTQEELRLAGSPETYTDRASVGQGTLPYARYFRVGQLILGYITEDGRHAAIWLSSPQGERWQSISDPGQVAQIRNAVEILDRQQAPLFVSLPIDISPSRSETAEP